MHWFCHTLTSKNVRLKRKIGLVSAKLAVFLSWRQKYMFITAISVISLRCFDPYGWPHQEEHPTWISSCCTSPQRLPRRLVGTHLSAVPPMVTTENIPMKKRSEETQTLHAGCSKAEPKKFHPAADLLPEVWDHQNLISWRWSLPLPTDPVWWGSMHAISSYHGNRPTNRQDWLQYTAPLLC